MYQRTSQSRPHRAGGKIVSARCIPAKPRAAFIRAARFSASRLAANMLPTRHKSTAREARSSTPAPGGGRLCPTSFAHAQSPGRVACGAAVVADQAGQSAGAGVLDFRRAEEQCQSARAKKRRERGRRIAAHRACEHRGGCSHCRYSATGGAAHVSRVAQQRSYVLVN